MKFSLAVLLFVISACYAETWQPTYDTWQADLDRHEVIAISSGEKYLECSAYCAARDDVFDEEKCVAFFIHNNAECHLINAAYSGLTQPKAGVAYFTLSP